MIYLLAALAMLALGSCGWVGVATFIGEPYRGANEEPSAAASEPTDPGPDPGDDNGDDGDGDDGDGENGEGEDGENGEGDDD